MGRKYYTTCIFDIDCGRWFDQFGSYSRKEAHDEASELSGEYPVKVICHADTAEAMIAARDALAVPTRYRKA